MSTPKKMLIAKKSPWCLAAVFGAGLLAAIGCEEKPAAPPESKPQPPPASVTLRVGVAEDRALSEAIRRLRGEWAEVSGGELVVEDWTTDEVLGRTDRSGGSADLLIFASRHLGELCDADRLRPVRESTLQSDTLAVSDILPTVRERLMSYGGRTMALPLGCPTPLLSFDALQDTAPIEAWEDLGPGPRVSIRGSSPDDPRMLAYVLLTRVASDASHPSRQAILFDPATLVPRLSEPPFQHAMQAVAGALTAEGEAELSRVVWRLYLPVREDFSERLAAISEQERRELIECFEEGAARQRFASMPGSRTVYNPIAEQWQPVEGEPTRVTLLATSGRWVGVAARSRNAASAFRLASWLAGRRNAPLLSTASSKVAPARLSLAAAPDNWSGVSFPERPDLAEAVARRIGAASSESLRNRRGLVVPRIIRIDDYLNALGEAVRSVASGENQPQAALAAANDNWEKLTDEIGRERQRRAYRRHLGLEAYEPGVR